MRFTLCAAVLSLALAAAACAKHPAAPPALPGEPSRYGSGHLELSGAVALSRDFRTKGCWVSAPGDSVLSGYSVSILPDEQIASGGILIKRYQNDGSYPVARQDMYAALAVYFEKSALMPRGAILTDGPKSTLTVTVSDSGLQGRADFANWTGGTNQPGAVSGSITWRCADVTKT